MVSVSPVPNPIRRRSAERRRLHRTGPLAPLLCLAMLATFVVAAPPAQALTSHIVTASHDAPDANPGDNVCADATGECTLRAAVEESLATFVAQVDGGSLLETDFLIQLAGDTTYTLTSEIELFLPVAAAGGVRPTITVAGPATNWQNTVIEGSGGHRLFRVTANAVASVQRVRLTGGDAVYTGPAGTPADEYDGHGGAILVDDGQDPDVVSRLRTGFGSPGELRASFILVDRNTAAGDGGGIGQHGGIVILLQMQMSRNTAGRNGGGIGAVDIASFTHPITAMQKVGLINNSADGDGGGVYGGRGHQTTVRETTIAGNSAGGTGGGMAAYRLDGDDQFGNRLGIIHPLHVTISANTAAAGAGGFAVRNETPTADPLPLTAVILSANSGTPANCGVASVDVTVVSLVGTDCVEAPGGEFAFVTDVPELTEIYVGDVDNVGRWAGPDIGFVMPLWGTSLARNVVSPCPNIVDYRGTTLPGGSACDIGAVEHPTPQRGADWDVSFERFPLELIDLDTVDLQSLRDDAIDGQVAAAGLREADIAASPLAAIPLAAIPLAAIDLTATPLAAILLPDVPVDGGWEVLLEGSALEGSPPQTLTLAQALTDPDVKAAFDNLTLAQVDLAATPLAAIPLAAISLATVPLAAIPLGGAATGTDALGEWCSQLAALGFACADLGIDPADPADDTTLTSIALQGVPLAAIPLAAIPLAAIPLAAIDLQASPLAAIPLAAIDLAASPLAAIPLAAIDIQASPLAAIPLAAIPLAAIPLAAITIQTSPLAAIDVAGTPLAAIPLAAIDLQASPLAAIPLAAIDMAVSPLAAIPLAAIATSSTPLAAIPLAAIPLAAIELEISPLAAIPLAAIADPSSVTDCTTCTTLGEAAEAGQILPGATIANLQEATSGSLNGFDLGSLAGDTNGVTLGGISELLGGFELGDLDGVQGSLADVVATLTQAQRDAVVAALQQLTLDQIQGAEPEVFGLLLGALTDVGDTSVADLLSVVDFSQVPGDMTLADLLYAIAPDSAYPWREVAPENIDSLAAVGSGIRMTLDSHIQDIYGTIYGDVQLQQLNNKGLEILSVTATRPGGQPEPVTAISSSPGHWILGVQREDRMRFVVEFALADGVTEPPATLGFSEGLTGYGFLSVNAPLSAAIDTLEPNDTPAEATPVGSGSLIISPVSHAQDVDLFAIDVDAGERLSVALDHLPADYDLFVYAPPTVPLSGAPEESIVPVEDTVDDLLAAADKVNAEITGDVVLVADDLLASSRQRGLDPERIDLPPARSGGTYLVQVSGHNGAFSTDSYSLRMRTSVAIPEPGCLASSTPLGPNGFTAPPPTQLAPGTDTVYLVAPGRLAAQHGDVIAQQILNQLDTTVAAGVHGSQAQVVPIDGASAVQLAFGEFDASPCSPDAANGVVKAITDLLNPLLDGSDVEHLVIVGDDTQIPFARLADDTAVANERGYASATAEHTQVAGSLRRGTFMSDDPYADPTPIDAGTRQVHLPELALGRLVETPDQIIGALQQFVAADGLLDPTSGSAAAGYDFLSDGTDAVSAALGNSPYGSPTLLNDNSWTRADLLDRLGIDGVTWTGPAAASIAAHFDHSRALPALGNATNVEDDLFTVDDLTADMPASLLFSMGCHSGLSISDGRGTVAPDWAQALSERQVAAWVANSGYAYGDTDVVAYTEALMTDFADRIGGTTSIGQALQYAKHTYFGSLATPGVYDEKVVQESVFYGLPMYRVNEDAPQASSFATDSVQPFAASAGLMTDPITGLLVEDVHVEPATERQVTPRGSYWTGGDGVQVTHDRPLQPLESIELVGPAARGAIITGLSSVDLPGIDPVTNRPIVDLAANEPEPANAVATYPAAMQRVTNLATPDGPASRLNLVSGQFIAAGTTGRGTQRLFTSIDAQVLHASGPGGDLTPPAIRATTAVIDPGTGDVVFAVSARDDQSAVSRVVVLYTDPTSTAAVRQWDSVELAPAGDGFSAVVDDFVGTEVAYVVQAVNADGRVAVSSDKARLHRDQTIVAGQGITISAGGATPSGAYAGDVEVTISTTTSGLEVAIDGGEFQTGYGSQAVITISGEGFHTIVAQDGFGGSASAVFSIDTTAPIVTLSQAIDGETFLQHSTVVVTLDCTDDGSGVADPDCRAWTLDTDDLGEHTLNATISDRLGNTVVVSALYEVEAENTAPDCASVVPSSTSLWPPNKKMHTVGLSGATDADGNTLTYEITAVHQDEPVGRRGPDAIIGGSTVQLRAERDGRGDGRVYVVAYTVTDTAEASCDGTVEVGVPKSQGSGGQAVNSGAMYDSTD